MARSTMSTRDIHIVGAGPAGLVAARYLAQAGYKPVVFEQSHDVGMAYQGTWQCLENWSTEEDATALLAAMGVAVNFRREPIAASTFYGPERLPHALAGTRPLVYLVQRGPRPGALDLGLKEQALAAGAEIRFGQRLDKTRAAHVIVATGAHSAEAHIEQVTFETSHPDRCIGFLDDDLAPLGHASLLVQDGRGTLSSWCFKKDVSPGPYLDRTLGVVQELGLDVESPRRLSGFVNFSMAPPWARGNFYFVGERAGFQDALWGFGLRYALVSGILAARAIAMNEDYDALCRRFIVPGQEVSLANRAIFHQLGHRGYEWALRSAAGHNVMGVLRRNYLSTRTKSLLHEIARQGPHPMLAEPACHGRDCLCIWCEHGLPAASHEMEGCSEHGPTPDGTVQPGQPSSATSVLPRP